jgi:hypothetical protein
MPEGLDSDGYLAREKTRGTLAIGLLIAMCVMILLTLIIGAYLVWVDKLMFENMLNLVLGVGSLFSGLMGSAVAFFFSQK